MAAAPGRNAALPLQRFIETLQSLRRTRWMERLLHHNPHQPTRAFVEDFIRVTTRLLAYIRCHRLLDPGMRQRQPPGASAREAVHARRVHREQLFAIMVRLHHYIDILRRLVRHAPPQQHQQPHPSSDNHRHFIDVLHVFTNFHPNSAAASRR